MLKIGFDIGGVISKYPEKFYDLIVTLLEPDNIINHIYFITDQHPKEEVIKSLQKNRFGGCCDNVHCADYEKYGNMAKAILIKELQLDIFIDDFDGYLQWDSSLGPQPLLLKVMPDAFKPYWADSWKTEGNSDFGRRKASTLEFPLTVVH